MLVNSDCTIPKVIPATSGGQLVIHNVGCIVPILSPKMEIVTAYTAYEAYLHKTHSDQNYIQ